MPFDPNLNPADRSGAIVAEDFAALQKALEAGYGTDVATLTGGGALRVQSLDKTMQATIQDNEHFVLFNKLQKTKPTATVDEWTEQSGVGGHVGGSTNTETGIIRESTGEYARRTGLVKYLMTRRQVSFVQTLQGAIADAEAAEYANGALQLLTDAEHLCFEGDSAVVPTEFDGIYAQMVAGVAAGLVDSRNIIDVRGGSLASINAVNAAAAQVSGFGNFGKITDLFCSQLVQADFDNNLDPAFRVPLTSVPGGGISIGSPVIGIRTSWGNIGMNPDVFIRDADRQLPFELMYPAIASAQVAIKPQTVAGVAAADAASQFATGQAGTYYYAVAGVNAAGASAVTKSAQVTVAVGDKVTLTIGASAGLGETGYIIYRGRLGGTNATADFREVGRVARTNSSTVWVDYNQDIPGTTKAYLLDMRPSAHAITWRQLLPMLKFALYPTANAVIPWAQLLFGFLRMTKRKHHAVIKNILPSSATWKPFG